MKSKMKVLVTGAAGRFSGWAIPQLFEDFDLKLTDRQAGELAGREIQELDITDYSAVLEAMRGMDGVVHLAIASQREIVTDSARFDADEGDEYLRFNEESIEVNVRGTYHLYEAARTVGARRFVFGSSLTTLFGQPGYPDFHSDLPARPVNFYAVTKLWGEQLGELFARKHGLTVYCLRYGQPFPVPNHPRHHEMLKTPARSRSSVSFSDIAGSIRAALTAENGPAFGSYLVVSATENPRFDCRKAEEIGWKSRTLFHDDGTMTPLAS